MIYVAAFHVAAYHFALYNSSLPGEYSNIKLVTEDGILFLQWDDVAYMFARAFQITHTSRYTTMCLGFPLAKVLLSIHEVLSDGC